MGIFRKTKVWKDQAEAKASEISVCALYYFDNTNVCSMLLT